MTRYAGGIVLLILGVIALFLNYSFVGAPGVGNDSVQYLDAAEHLAAGDCFCTTLAHFDEQVAVGHMPIPFTHFAPGLPLLLAGLSKLGLTPETAGYLISALSYITTIALFWWIGIALGANVWVLGALGFVWVTNSTALLIANFVSTEAVFTAMLLGLGVLMMADIEAAGDRPAILPAIGVLAGALYAVRYAGLFLIPVAGAYLAWRWWSNRRTFPWALTGLSAMAAICLSIMIRNVRLSGSWRGGFTNSQGHTVKFMLTESAKASYHLVFGDRVPAHLSLWGIVFVGALLCCIIFAFNAWRSERLKGLPKYFGTQVAWLVALMGFYLAGIVYAAMHSIASDLARYYLPVYPLVLALLAALLLARKPLESITVALLALAVLAIHSRSLLAPPPPTPTAEVSRIFREEVQPGISLQRWLTGHVSARDVVIASNGQAVHYVLQRPVVAIIDPIYSDQKTDEAGFHALMNRFGARYLLLFQGSQIPEEQRDIPFLRSVEEGVSSPAWLVPAAKTSDAILYECVSCVNAK